MNRAYGKASFNALMAWIIVNVWGAGMVRWPDGAVTFHSAMDSYFNAVLERDHQLVNAGMTSPLPLRIVERD